MTRLLYEISQLENLWFLVLFSSKMDPNALIAYNHETNRVEMASIEQRKAFRLPRTLIRATLPLRIPGKSIDSSWFENCDKLEYIIVDLIIRSVRNLSIRCFI